MRALSRGMGERRSFHAPEVYGRAAIGRIARELPLIERAYANVRFSILRPKLLSVMDLLLPDEGRILDIGCGFGLFAAYFGQTQPARRIVGVDPNERRIAMAKRVCAGLGLENEFVAGDARSVSLEGRFAGAYVLDVMHHIPADDQLPMLERLRDLLAPRGVLVLKDITTEPHLQLKFTRAHGPRDGGLGRAARVPPSPGVGRDADGARLPRADGARAGRAAVSARRDRGHQEVGPQRAPRASPSSTGYPTALESTAAAARSAFANALKQISVMWCRLVPACSTTCRLHMQPRANASKKISASSVSHVPSFAFGIGTSHTK